ncbi:MAG: hypothetical protein U9N09_09260 [Euryarchaeota archaeon]|nr:hypothetical protein [Euryarchaeota archaeon]
MAVRFILTDYVSQLLAYAVYDKLDDSTYAGRIPQCRGVVAFGAPCVNARMSSTQPSKIGF